MGNLGYFTLLVGVITHPIYNWFFGAYQSVAIHRFPNGDSKVHRWCKRRRQRTVEPHTASAKCQPDPPASRVCVSSMWNPLMFHKLKKANQAKTRDNQKHAFLKMFLFLRFASSEPCGNYCGSPLKFFQKSFRKGLVFSRVNRRTWRTFKTIFSREMSKKKTHNWPRYNVVKSQKNEHSPHVLLMFNRRIFFKSTTDYAISHLPETSEAL